MITTAQQLSSLGVRSEAGIDLALHAPRVSRSSRPRGSAAIPETRLEFPVSRESASPQVFQLASSRPELYSAFKLVYQEYLRTGLVRPNPFKMRVTPYHLLPTTDVIVGTVRSTGSAACTVSLVGDGQLGLPIETAFGEQVAERRRQGIRLAEVTSLADNREVENTGTSLVLQAMIFMAQRAKRTGIDELLITVHPHHAKFYQRFIGFELIGEERPFGSVLDNPAVPLALDLGRWHVNHPRAYERYSGNLFPAQSFYKRPLSFQMKNELRRIVAACELANSISAPTLAKTA